MSQLQSTTGQVRPFKEIPYVTLPDDYPYHLPELLAQAYEQHGPIFRANFFGHDDIVFMVGPEANRFMLVQQRQKFSNHIGWGTVFQVEQMLGRGLLIEAVLVTLATIYGRYHYTADCLASIALTVAAAGIVFVLDRRRTAEAAG